MITASGASTPANSHSTAWVGLSIGQGGWIRGRKTIVEHSEGVSSTLTTTGCCLRATDHIDNEQARMSSPGSYGYGVNGALPRVVLELEFDTDRTHV